MRESAPRIRLGVRQSIEELTGGRILKRGTGAPGESPSPHRPDHANLEPAERFDREDAAGAGDWERAP